jgi:hypothetical protein
LSDRNHLNHMKEVDEFIAAQKQRNLALSESLDNISTDLETYVARLKALEGASGLTPEQKAELVALSTAGDDLVKRVQGLDLEHPGEPTTPAPTPV